MSSNKPGETFGFWLSTHADYAEVLRIMKVDTCC